MSISENTSKIEQLLAAISALPEAGNGGIDTSDATATADDMADGKTAYVNGKKISGRLPEYTAEYGAMRLPIQTNMNFSTPTDSDPYFSSTAEVDTSYIIRAGAKMRAEISAASLGDATTEDVAKGKTFTSANGLKLTGTFEGGGLPSGVSKLASGTYTPTQDISSGVDISHGLGVTPNFFIWWVEEDVSINPTAYLLTQGALIKKTAQYNTGSSIIYTLSYLLTGYNSTPQYGGVTNRVSNNTYMTNNTCRMHSSSTYKLLTGHTYRWVAGVADGVL